MLIADNESKNIIDNKYNICCSDEIDEILAYLPDDIVNSLNHRYRKIRSRRKPMKHFDIGFKVWTEPQANMYLKKPEFLFEHGLYNYSFLHLL